MKNFVQPGDTLDFTAPAGGVVAGSPVFIGALLVIPTVTAAAGVTFAGDVKGVFVVAKATSQTWAEGAIVYWDDTGKAFTTTSSGNTKQGCAVKAAGSSDATGTVRLNGVV